jgi:hypothetical protein
MMNGMRTLLATLLLAVVVGGCAPTTPPDGSLPCNETIDQQRAVGFDIVLEAALPVVGWDATPVTVDSGRECSQARLGPLWGAGIRELRSAGAIFELPDKTGYSLVVYSAAGLTLDNLAYAFERGARGGRKTQGLSIVDIKVGTWPAKQFTLINGDHRQVITLFDTGEADRVRALLTSDISNALIADRLAAYAAALQSP